MSFAAFLPFISQDNIVGGGVFVSNALPDEPLLAFQPSAAAPVSTRIPFFEGIAGRDVERID